MSEDYKIQVSLKTPTQTLINLRAGDEAELSEQLEVLGRQLKSIGEVEAIMAAMSNIYTGLSPIEKIKLDAEAAASRPAGQPAAQQASAPAGQGKSCQHGPMTYKEGVSAGSGKAWKAYMCAAPKTDPSQCKPEWIR